jgi:hypothetical protein
MRPGGADRRHVLERRSARGRGALWRAEERSLGAGAASAVSFGAPSRGEHRRGVVLCGDEKNPIQTLERT